MKAFCYSRFATVRPFAAFAVTLTAVVPLLLLAAPRAANAQQTLAQSTAANGTFTNVAPGQSVTIAGSGAFNNLVFNFVGNGTPIAPGTLFLLSQEYLGTPAALSASTPGFIASVAGNNNLYTFASATSVQGGTQYFFYGNAAANTDTGNGDPYTGGDFYFATDPNSSFQTLSGFDATFRLQGTAVAAAAPEPGTLPLLGMGLVTGAGLVSTVRRRKAIKQAA